MHAFYIRKSEKIPDIDFCFLYILIVGTEFIGSGRIADFYSAGKIKNDDRYVNRIKNFLAYVLDGRNKHGSFSVAEIPDKKYKGNSCAERKSPEIIERLVVCKIKYG